MKLRGLVVVMVMLFGGVADVLAQGRETCEFGITARAPEAKFTGPEEILTRVHLLKQLDSPVAVVAADFSEAKLGVGGEWATFEGPYYIDVVNLSDRTLDQVHVQVSVRSQHGGFGGGVGWKSPLAPSVSARLSNRPGARGQGTAPDDVVDVIISIESVWLDGCEYRPAKVLPPVRK